VSSLRRGCHARCEPNEIAFVSDKTWTDATCSAPAATDFSRLRPCAAPSAAIGYPDDTNVSIHEYYELGARLPHGYSTYEGTCAVVEDDPSEVFYEQGAVIPDASLPMLDRVLDGTGRIRAVRYEKQFPLRRANAMFDMTADEACYPQPFTDGTTRCVRTSVAYGSATDGVYRDASCTEPLAQRYGTDTVDAILIEHENACGGDTKDESFAVGPVYTGVIYGGTPCAPMPPAPGTTYLTPGEPLEFPVLVER
jgi:hypothetical protein